MLIKDTSKKLLDNKIGVIPTDTIYGIAASALSKKAVARSYKILKRNPKKPFIILISSISDLALFNIKLDSSTQNILETLWPGKISVVLPCLSPKWKHLHRGTQSLAFRLPKKAGLQKLLKLTGPLISTSANPEGAKPAETIVKAKDYFRDQVDFYVDGGKIKSLPSTLVEIKKGQLSVIRQGIVKLDKKLIIDTCQA